jgi:hypothetical protein
VPYPVLLPELQGTTLISSLKEFGSSAFVNRDLSADRPKPFITETKSSRPWIWQENTLFKRPV